MNRVPRWGFGVGPLSGWQFLVDGSPAAKLDTKAGEPLVSITWMQDRKLSIEQGSPAREGLAQAREGLALMPESYVFTLSQTVRIGTPEGIYMVDGPEDLFYSRMKAEAFYVDWIVCNVSSPNFVILDLDPRGPIDAYALEYDGTRRIAPFSMRPGDVVKVAGAYTGLKTDNFDAGAKFQIAVAFTGAPMTKQKARECLDPWVPLTRDGGPMAHLLRITPERRDACRPQERG
jgi:hypothetical protein